MNASNGEDRTRPAYADLLEQYRLADGRPWHAIDAKLGINPKTRAQWFSGYTKKPALASILRLVRELNVPLDVFSDSVIEGDFEQPSGTLYSVQLADHEERLLEVEHIAEGLPEGMHELIYRVSRLERVVLNRASDQEVLALEAELAAVLGEGEGPQAGEAR